MVRQNFVIHAEHIAALRKELNEVKFKLENTNNNVATSVGDEFESRDLEGSLSVGEQCFSDNSCSSGTCFSKPYAFCSVAPTTSPTRAGVVGRPCDLSFEKGRDPGCGKGLFCHQKYVYIFQGSCAQLFPRGHACNKHIEYECASGYCNAHGRYD